MVERIQVKMVVGKRSCVRTALTVFDSIVLPGDLRVSEYVRERMGVDTCDARRAINSHRASTDVSDVSVQAGTNVSDLLVLAGTDVSDVLAQASTAAEEQNVDERGSEQRRKMVEVGAPGGAAEVDKKHHRRERVDCPYRQVGTVQLSRTYVCVCVCLGGCVRARVCVYTCVCGAGVRV